MNQAHVKLMTIGEIGPILMCKRILKYETSPVGDVPFYKVGTLGRQADAFISQELFERYKYAYPYPNKGDILLSVAGTVGRAVVFDGKSAYFQDSNIVWVRNDESKVLNSYLYYCYQLQPWQASTGWGISRLYTHTLRNAVIPVVSLPVQREIVRILDVLTSKTEELKTTLASEFDLRKRQHSFYADKLLRATHPAGDWKTVEEVIVSLKTGLNPRQYFKLNAGGTCPYITSKDLVNNVVNVTDKTDLITAEDVELINRRACLAGNDVLFACTGTGTVGRMAVVEGYDCSWTVSEAIYCLKPKLELISSQYLMYVLYSHSSRAQFEPKISKGTIPRLKIKDLLGVKIPVPSLSEQERVVSSIQQLDALYSDMATSLTAEIEARQKQYTYCLNKLLGFDKISG